MVTDTGVLLYTYYDTKSDKDITGTCIIGNYTQYGYMFR